MPAKNHSSAEERTLQAFERACLSLEPLAPGRRLLLACSAGGDSMTLLNLAARYQEERNWTLAVVHLDHCQRPQSADEARFVLEQAARLSIPAFIERLGKNIAAASPLSEDVMRQARHACYSRFAHIWHADAILLAHQADDRAETFLIRLLAGSGPTGLGSIRPVEQIGELTLVRPLLGVRRADMRLFLESCGASWHDDPSNEDPATKRGWIRHTLLPLVRERIDIDPTDRIVRSAELLQEEAATLGEAARLIIEEISLPSDPPASARLDLLHPIWRQASPLLRRQLLRQWLWDLRRGPHPPGFEAVSEALTFVQQARPGAELRTVERIHIVHCKTSLLAFPPDIDAPARQAATAPCLPPRIPKAKKHKHAD